MAVQKQDIVVTLQVKELVFDVMNKTHLTGISRLAEGAKDYEASAHMQASADDEHSYQIRRSICNAFSELKTELGEYIKEDAKATDNKIKQAVDDDATLTLTFSMPSNFNNSSCDSLGGGTHEYIVSRAISDWFTITNKADAAEYLEIAKTALERCKRALYKRSRPTRPNYGG